MTDHAFIVWNALSWCEEGEIGNRHRAAGLAALAALEQELAEAKAKSRIDEQQCDDMTEAAIAAYGRAEAAELALDAAMTKLGNLSRIAAEEIERNPALGIPGYRKGALARAVLADKEGT